MNPFRKLWESWQNWRARRDEERIRRNRELFYKRYNTSAEQIHGKDNPLPKKQPAPPAPAKPTPPKPPGESPHSRN